MNFDKPAGVTPSKSLPAQTTETYSWPVPFTVEHQVHQLAVGLFFFSTTNASNAFLTSFGMGLQGSQMKQ